MLDPPHLLDKVPPPPRPHCSIFVKPKRGVGPDQSKRGPEGTRGGIEGTRPTVNEDPKGPEKDPKGPDHCK